MVFGGGVVGYLVLCVGIGVVVYGLLGWFFLDLVWWVCVDVWVLDGLWELVVLWFLPGGGFLVWF